MSCTNPFCTCCRDAYLEGLKDGYDLGYKRGHRHGYVAGFTDATLQIAPRAAYRDDIQRVLDRINTPRPLPKPWYAKTAWELEHEPLIPLPELLPLKHS